MQKTPYRYLNYLLISVLSVVVLSNCLNVLSDSSARLSPPEEARPRPTAPQARSGADCRLK